MAAKQFHALIGIILVALMCLADLALDSSVVGASELPPDSTGTVWLCRPGQANDPCTESLATTVIGSNGSRHIVDLEPAADPPIDCFYLYPNVTHQTTNNANLFVEPQETAIAELEASPFSQDCRVFAPMYRESTGHAPTGAATRARQIAYDSVLNAWRDYLTHYNDGRGVVLIGHSEGSSLLSELVANQVDKSPQVRQQLVSSILTGLDYPVGPCLTLCPCKTSNEIHCLVDYNAYAGEPPSSAQFGHLPEQDGKPVEDICTNPANLVGGDGTLDSMYRTRLPTQDVAGSTSEGILATPIPSVSTPWIEYERGYSGSCVTNAGNHVLVVQASRQVPGLRSFPDAAFGLHVDDPNLAMGNLVRLVRSQATEYLTSLHSASE